MGPVYESAPVVAEEVGCSPDSSPVDRDTDGAAGAEVGIASVRVFDPRTELPGGTEPELVFEGVADLLATTVSDGATELAGGTG